MKPPDRRESAAGGTAARGDTGQQTSGKNTTTERFAVLIDKRPDCVVVFSTHGTREAAERQVVSLAAVSLVARVAPALASDCPGAERRAVKAGRWPALS